MSRVIRPRPAPPDHPSSMVGDRPLPKKPTYYHRCGRRRTLIGSLARQGRHDEARRVISDAIVLARGKLNDAAATVDLCPRQLDRYLDLYPELRAVVASAKARRRAGPRWLARTLEALEDGGTMSMLEQILQVAQGMSVEEIQAEFEASDHAGSCDPETFARALAAQLDAAAG